MSFRVVIDSCGELTDEMKKRAVILCLHRWHCRWMSILYRMMRNISTRQSFLKKVAECPTCPKSSCPSPEIYRDAYDCDADHVLCSDAFQKNWVDLTTVQFLVKISIWRIIRMQKLCIQFLLGIWLVKTLIGLENPGAGREGTFFWRSCRTDRGLYSLTGYLVCPGKSGHPS